MRKLLRGLYPILTIVLGFCVIGPVALADAETAPAILVRLIRVCGIAGFVCWVLALRGMLKEIEHAERS
jgi:hypothetical protein